MPVCLTGVARMAEQQQEHVSHEATPQGESIQDAYEVADGPIATRLALLENEVASLKQQLGQAQQQANLVPELLHLMARLCARYMPDEHGQMQVSLPQLSPTQQVLFHAATRVLPGALAHPSEDAAMAAAHAAGMPYPGAEMANGLGPEHVHPSMQPSVEHLAAFAAIAQYGQDGGLKKRKSDGATTFGRGAPGQKRYCPLCKNPDGSPMALAGNHNASCPWCKKCWAKKQQVLKVDCPMHNPPEGAGAPPLAAAAMPPMPDEHHDTSVGHVDHQMSLSESAGPPPNIVPLSVAAVPQGASISH